MMVIKRKPPRWRASIVSGLIAAGLLLSLSGEAIAISATLAWNRNAEEDLAGYKIHIGTFPGNYSRTIDVGHVTTATISDLGPGETYFITVTAYDIFANESDYSVEIRAIIPDPLLVPSGPPPTAGTAGTGSLSQSGATSLQPTASTKVSGLPASTIPPIAPSPSPGLKGRGEGASSEASAGIAVEGSATAGGSMGGSSSAVVGGAGRSTTGEIGSPVVPPSARTGSGSVGAPAEEGLLRRLLAAFGLESAGRRDAKAADLYEEGRTLMTEGNFEDAILRYQEAERLWQGLGATGDAALAAEGLGTAYYGAVRYLEALDAYGRALQLYRQVKHREREADILENIGVTYEALAQHDTAVERYRAALEIWLGLGRDEQAAKVLDLLRAAQAAAGR